MTPKFADIQDAADHLSLEEQGELVVHLLDRWPAPGQVSDEEVAERIRELESGESVPMTHAEFLAAVGR